MIIFDLQFIKAEVFMPCLFDLCRALWEVVLSYKKTSDWHSIYDNEDILLNKSSSGGDRPLHTAHVY